MFKHSSVIAKGLLFSVFVVVLFSFSNRHLVVAQDSDSKTHKAIKVVISATGADDDDTIAAKGDTIEFCPDQPSLKFSIIFTKSPFEPLGQGKLRFDERDCGHPETVGHKPHDHARAYDYVLAVGAKYFDPHVIIMGN
jgi:hypothetical protein